MKTSLCNVGGTYTSRMRSPFLMPAFSAAPFSRTALTCWRGRTARRWSSAVDPLGNLAAHIEAEARFRFVNGDDTGSIRCGHAYADAHDDRAAPTAARWCGDYGAGGVGVGRGWFSPTMLIAPVVRSRSHSVVMAALLPPPHTPLHLLLLLRYCCCCCPFPTFLLSDSQQRCVVCTISFVVLWLFRSFILRNVFCNFFSAHTQHNTHTHV